MNTLHSIVLILVIAGVTMLLRFLPFAAFSGKRRVPDYILYLGSVLPYAIMGMLIVYCLRSVQFTALSRWLPSAICVAVVAALHVWKRNTILSIVCVTVLYMILIQTVFV